MHAIGESWRGQDGMVWRVVGYNSLACTYMLDAEGDARQLVSEAWFDSASKVRSTFRRWWGPRPHKPAQAGNK